MFASARQLLPTFKAAMARVSSQAMILTAAANGETLHGMTLSSVCLLSVQPRPLLQFNLHLPSYTSAALHRNGAMAIHVMPPTHTLVMLGRKFASGVKRDPEHFSVSPDDGETFHEKTTPFSDIPDHYTLHLPRPGVSIPVLRELEVAFICKTHSVFAVDSHEMWVVHVEDILFPNKRFHDTPSGGLLYYDRGFHAVGAPLKE